MNLNNLEIFAKVAETNGISAAARALKMPKSRVSRRMSALESELGVRLLERTTRAVHLTEAGELLAQHCHRIVEERNSALATIDRMSEAPRGSLHVSASLAVGQQLVAPLVSEFLARYPDVRLNLHMSNRRVDVVAEGFDTVIRIGELEDSTLVSRKLCTSRSVAVATHDYVAKCGKPKTPADLDGHKRIAMIDAPGSGRWTLKNTQGLTETVASDPSIELNDLTSIKQIALDHGGIALLPVYMVSDSIEAQQLVRLLPNWTSMDYSIHCVYPSHRGMTPKLRAWIDYLASELATFE